MGVGCLGVYSMEWSIMDSEREMVQEFVSDGRVAETVLAAYH